MDDPAYDLCWQSVGCFTNEIYRKGIRSDNALRRAAGKNVWCTVRDSQRTQRNIREWEGKRVCIRKLAQNGRRYNKDSACHTPSADFAVLEHLVPQGWWDRAAWTALSEVCEEGGRKKEWHFSSHEIKDKNIILWEVEKMQILIWVMMIVGGAAGLLSTAYLVLAMPIILVWKIFRKVKYHIAICDWWSGFKITDQNAKILYLCRILAFVLWNYCAGQEELMRFFCEEADYSMNNQKNPIGILSNWMEMKLWNFECAYRQYFLKYLTGWQLWSQHL